MGWDATNKVLYHPFTKIAASGRGDLENALGRTCKSEVQLVRDIDSNGTRQNKINKWAKFKPIPRPNVSYAEQLKTVNGQLVWKSVAELEAELKTPWWIGNDGKCGFAFSTSEALGTVSSGFLYNLMQSAGLPWTYTPPSGASSQPLRAYDFIQYYADAMRPVTGINNNLKVVSGNLTVYLDTVRGLGDLNVNLSDMTINGVAGSNFYIGVLIYKTSSAGGWTFAFSTSTVGNGAETVSFTNMNSFTGNVTIVPFFASKRANQGIDPGNGVYLSCDVLPATMEIKSGSPSPTGTTTYIDASWRDDFHGRVRYTVKIVSTSNVTANNMVINLYDGYQNIGTRNIGTVNAGPSYSPSSPEFTGSFPVDNYDSSKTYKLIVTSSNSDISGETDVEPYRA